MHNRQHVPSSAFNADIEGQANYLRDMLGHTEHLWEILGRSQEIELPYWYLGAGCISQTYWNYKHGFDPSEHVKDVDIAYYDAADLSESAEHQHEQRIRTLFADLPLRFDVKNQARVHLWYEQRFGYPITPYRSVEDAINTWPTTATSVGVRWDRHESRIYAPFGLNDLFGMIVRPNKAQITREIYEVKANRWIKCWSKLTVIPWERS